MVFLSVRLSQTIHRHLRMSNEKNIGEFFPGQAWIELNGRFTFAELREIALKVEESYLKAHERKNGHI